MLSTTHRYMGRKSHDGGDVDFSLDYLSLRPSDASTNPAVIGTAIMEFWLRKTTYQCIPAEDNLSNLIPRHSSHLHLYAHIGSGSQLLRRC